MAYEGHGNHWQCLFDVENGIRDWLPVMVERGCLIDPRPANDGLGAGEVVGIAYPDTPLRTLSLIVGMRKNGTMRQVLASAYPFAVKGVRRRLVVEDVIPWQGDIEAWIRTSFPDGDGPELTFFDSRYYANKKRIGVGMEADFILAGMAYFAEVVHPEPILIETPDVIRAMRAGTDRADDPSPVEVRMEGAAILFPREERAPHEYEFQAPVTAVEAFDLLGRRMVRLTVTVARLIDHEDEDVAIDLYVSDHVWGSNERPMPGADVRGLMWLQGYLADAGQG